MQPPADALDVPSFYEFASSDKVRQMLRFIFSSDEFGRPYFAAPGVPEDRLAALRTAFADALNDPALLSEAEKLQLDMTYRPPAALDRFLHELYATPLDLIKEIQEIAPGP
jgi:tripartite-type tricarboxylate transporter receptor subunit TctC